MTRFRDALLRMRRFPECARWRHLLIGGGHSCDAGTNQRVLSDCVRWRVTLANHGSGSRYAVTLICQFAYQLHKDKPIDLNKLFSNILHRAHLSQFACLVYQRANRSLTYSLHSIVLLPKE